MFRLFSISIMCMILSACASTVPVRVETHAVQAGTLSLGDTEAAFSLISALRDAESVVFIYDASGSMRWPIRTGGEERYKPAFRALNQFIDRLGANDNVSILVYGSVHSSGISGGQVTDQNRAITSCTKDIEQIIPLVNAGEKKDIKAKIKHLGSVNSYKGDTPIGGALAKAADLLKDKPGIKRIVLLTDGVEECFPLVKGSPNPLDVVKKLADLDVTLDVVFAGGGLNSQGQITNRSRDSAEHLRKLATGQFYEASSYDELVDALLRMEIAKFQFEMIDTKGVAAAKAKIGSVITIPSGRYTLKSLAKGGFQQEITIPPSPAVRIFMALSKNMDNKPDLIVQPFNSVATTSR